LIHRPLSICLLALSFVANAAAQTTNSSILGSVTDSLGAAVPGSAVVLTHTATGVQRRIESAGNGEYRFFPLNAGIYEVAVEKAGFKKRIQNRVLVGVAEAVKVDFELQVGDVATAVEVNDAVPLLQTQETSVGGAITGAELTRLPVNGRNYTRLIFSCLARATAPRVNRTGPSRARISTRSTASAHRTTTLRSTESRTISSV